MALLYHNYNLPCRWNDLTIREINELLGQIHYVSPLERIRYYLRDIKRVLFSMFTKDYQADPEYDEDEDAETREQDELYKTQLEAIKHGIPPPKGWA